MAEDPGASLPGIAALPPTTARQIGSGQVLVDPSSVVKELIDNALDARAKSIFVDITANTIDTIQVKDDGHGIPAEDRPLVCRRHCTSKIRDLRDLKEVGGKWLGFRGEALSSMAEMSDSLLVTTRVEGEPVAVKLKFQRNGELDKVAHESHPVGTTVKITGFFKYTPVRKQTAIKKSSKWLAKIRHLLQAYAFARPAMRFRLHVLRDKSNKSDFFYTPSSTASIEDAALKVIGKDCALQCDWTTLQVDGFEIRAFLPKATAIGSKISNHGAFISVDARPVSSLRGTIKQMVAAFKTRIRKMSPSLAGVKDPFICFNIVCPPDSYDPNIEPAKDDVMFENTEIIIGVFNQLLNSYYPETTMVIESNEPSTSAQQPQPTQAENPPSRTHKPAQVDNSHCNPLEGGPASDMQKQPRWRSIMYGIDKDDMQFMQDEQPPTVEGEVGVRDVEVSNPWTIARMNVAIKPRKTVAVNHLLSPAKGQNDDSPQSSPAAINTPRRGLPTSPLTPQSLSMVNASNQLDDELERNITYVAPHSPGKETRRFENITELTPQPYEAPRITPLNTRRSIQPNGHSHSHGEANMELSGNDNIVTSAQGMHLPKSSAPRQIQRRQQTAYANKPFAAPTAENNDTWFGQPMRGFSSQPTSRQKRRPRAQETSMFPNELSSSPRRPVLNAVDRIVENRLYSDANTDIRDFFRRGSGPRHGIALPGSPTLIKPTPRGGHQNSNEGPHDIGEQLKAYAERSSPTRESSAAAISMLLDTETGQSHQHSHSCAIGLRPSSMGSERHLLSLALPPHPPTTKHDPSKSTKSQEIAAHLKAIEAREALLSPQHHRSAHKNEPPAPLTHHKPTTSTQLRCRTTDTHLEHTKSSKPLLERVPHGFRAQNLILPLRTSIASIVQGSQKLDIRLNSLKWGYPADDAFDAFAEPASAVRVTGWTVELDSILHELFGRLSDVDTVCLLHEGVLRGLDGRAEREQGLSGIERAVSVVGHSVSGATAGNGSLNGDGGQGQGEWADEGEQHQEGGFDISQYVNWATDVSGSAAKKVCKEDSSMSDDEFKDEIDDDMLLDL